jgi:aminopeptidase N
MKPFNRLFAVALGAALLAPYASAGAAERPQKPPRPYGRGEASYHATATAPYTFENEIVKLSFDFAKGVVYGQTTNVIHPKADGLQTIPFDSVGLHYSGVTVNGATTPFHVFNDQLVIDLAQPAKAGDRLEIVATYTTTPVRGIYFIRPDAKYPGMQPEIWSQGEAEDNRRWYPTWDEPNEKSPTELIVTVQNGWTVIANGALKSQTNSSDGATTTFDWVEKYPHSSYLTAFSAGPYVKFHTATTRPDGSEIPVDYFTSTADAPYARLCFGRTKDIVAFFQQIIGVTYPWEKYDQTTAERFVAGGMENVSATTQTEFAIHPPSWDLVRPCDGLVAHELSHQWWGDDVTTPDWANIWINEGYATYFQELWSQQHFGEARFEYERYDAQQSYFQETKRYWRPIVDYVYTKAIDSFDASGYPRPGQVLHMLRWMYGDKRFFGALRDYLTEYQHKTATTHQFFASISKSLGENLDWFEQEWFYRAAYPHFYVTQTYDAASKTLNLDVTQKNHDGKPFRMPIDVAVYVNGHGTLYRFTADRNHQVVPLPHVAAAPEMVLFDPDNNVLRELDYKKSVNQLGYQLLHAPSVGDRLWAAAQLDSGVVSKADRKLAMQFLRDAVVSDHFYGVRAGVLDQVAGYDDASTIREAMKDSDLRVQIAALGAVKELDHPGNPALVAAIRALLDAPNPLLASAAYAAYGATKSKDAYAVLTAGLAKDSFRQAIAMGAIQGFGSLGDPRAIPVVEQWAAYGGEEAVRPSAIAALAKLAKKNPSLAQSFLEAVVQSDPYFRARSAAAQALGTLGQASSIPVLEAVEKTDGEESVQSAAWDAIADIKDATKGKKTAAAAGPPAVGSPAPGSDGSGALARLSALTGKPATAVTFVPIGGAPVPLVTPGKPTVVIVFASWCFACMDEMPRNLANYAKYKDRVNFLGIDYQDGEKSGAAVIAKYAIPFPIERDGMITDRPAGAPEPFVMEFPGTTPKTLPGTVAMLKSSLPPEKNAVLADIVAHCASLPDADCIAYAKAKGLTIGGPIASPAPADSTDVSLPTTFVLDANGVVVKKLQGYAANFDDLAAALDRLLKSAPAPSISSHI